MFAYPIISTCNNKIKLLLVVQVIIILFISSSLNATSEFKINNATALYFNTNKDTVVESVKIKIIPSRSSGIFNGNKIKYKIQIENTYKEPQKGRVVFEVKTDKNKLLLGGLYDVVVPGNGSLTIKSKFKVTDPGFYDYNTRINLTDYDDTIRNVFGFKPQLITTPEHNPADFEKFWTEAKKELSTVEPKYTIAYNQNLSTRTHQYYDVQMQSLDNITIHGWLSIPRLGGKFPVLLVMPGYKQVLKPMFPDDQAIFCLTVRSVAQMNQKGKNPKDEPEYCMVNMHNKDEFIYRGAYMDCLRAMDFLFANSRLGLDTNRIIVFGGSQGGSFALITAALDHRVAICGADNPLYCDIHKYYEIANNRTPDAFPIKYYNQYIRNIKVTKASLLKTLDYIDPQNFIPYIKCPTLIALGTLDPIAPPSCVYAAYNKLNVKAKRKSEIHILSNIGHEITEEYSFIKFLWIEENTANSLVH